ncbi:MAG: PQQ-like beta-propeller repeat protein [Propionibacteriaceae bacterium]|jgi:hypothetical protein|nr:PQQ-like beta-propeller repeat protein [Propionibacteriaceae bacterium]
MTLIGRLKRQNQLPPAAPGTPLTPRAETELAQMLRQAEAPARAAATRPSRSLARSRGARWVAVGAIACALALIVAGVTLWRRQPDVVATPTATPTPGVTAHPTVEPTAAATAAVTTADWPLPTFTDAIDLAAGLDPALAGQYGLDPDFAYPVRADLALFAVCGGWTWSGNADTPAPDSPATYVLRAIEPSTGAFDWTLDLRDVTGLTRIDVARTVVDHGQVAVLAGDSARADEPGALWLVVADLDSGEVTAQAAVAWADFALAAGGDGAAPLTLATELAWSDGVIVWQVQAVDDAATLLTAVRADDPATIVWQRTRGATFFGYFPAALQDRWVFAGDGYVNAADGLPAAFGATFAPAGQDTARTLYEEWPTYGAGATTTTVFRETWTALSASPGGMTGFEPWDTATDQPLWDAPVTSATPLVYDHFVVGDLVIVTETPPGDGAAPIEGGRVSAYSLATGERVWTWTGPAGATGSFGVIASQLVGDDLVAVNLYTLDDADSQMCLLDLATGGTALCAAEATSAPGPAPVSFWTEHEGVVNWYWVDYGEDFMVGADSFGPDLADPGTYVTSGLALPLGPNGQPIMYYFVDSPDGVPYKAYLSSTGLPLVTINMTVAMECDGPGETACTTVPIPTLVSFLLFPA